MFLLCTFADEEYGEYSRPMRLKGCQRGRHQNFPSSFDCYGPGA